MAFFNFYMLIGILAISIPILIHILNQKSAKLVQWGAMRFLKDAMVSRRKKILLEEILLMCLRCLLVLLLALVAARPFITPGSTMSWLVSLPLVLIATGVLAASFILGPKSKGKRSLRVVAILMFLAAAIAFIFEERLQSKIFSTKGGRDIALIIDASDSMTLSVNGIENFVKAIDESKRIIDTAPAGSAFSLIVGGAIPYAPIANPLSSREEVLAAIEQIKVGKGTMPVPETFSLAALTLARGNNSAKQIILIGDGQREGWKLDGEGRNWEAVQESIAQLPGNTSVLVRRLEIPEQVRNAAISSISFSRDVVGLDRPLSIYVTVSNHGGQAFTPGTVLLKVEGQTYKNEELGQMAPYSERTIIFEHQFLRTGPRIVDVEMTGQDDIASDNRSWRVVTPIETLNVLIIDGSTSLNFMEKASAFTALALAPRIDSDAVLIRPKVLTAADLRNIESLDDYKAVLLLDVPRLSAGIAELLGSYVAEGGGLLIALGPQSNRDFYNNWTLNEFPVLPATIGQKLFLNSSSHSESVSLLPESLNYSALEFLKENPLDLEQVVFQAYWELKPPEDSTETTSQVGFRFTNEDPFLVSQPLGEGKVIQLATGLDTQESNFASTKAFVIFIHQLVYHLAESGSVNLNLPYQLGSTLSLSSLIPVTNIQDRKDVADLNFDELSPPLWFNTSGQSEEGRFLVLKDSSQDLSSVFLTIPPLVSPGVYGLALDEKIQKYLTPLLTDSKQLPIALINEQDEGRVTPLNDGDREKIRKYILWQEALSSDQMVNALEGARFGRELWRPLALMVFAFLVAEIAIGRWIATRRKIGQDLKIDFQERNNPKASFLKQLAQFKKT